MHACDALSRADTSRVVFRSNPLSIFHTYSTLIAGDETDRASPAGPLLASAGGGGAQRCLLGGLRETCLASMYFHVYANGAAR